MSIRRNFDSLTITAILVLLVLLAMVLLAACKAARASEVERGFQVCPLFPETRPAGQRTTPDGSTTPSPSLPPTARFAPGHYFQTGASNG